MKLPAIAMLLTAALPALSAHRLYDFEAAWEGEEWQSPDPESQVVRIADRFATSGKRAIELESKGSAFVPELKGLVWDNDWEHFEFLSFDLVNPMPHKLRIKVFFGEDNGYAFWVDAPAMSAKRYVNRIKFPKFARRNNIIYLSFSTDVKQDCSFVVDRIELLKDGEIEIYDRGKKGKEKMKGEKLVQDLPEFAQAMKDESRRWIETRCDAALKEIAAVGLPAALEKALTDRTRELRKQAKEMEESVWYEAESLPLAIARAKATASRRESYSRGKDAPFMVFTAHAQEKVFPREKDATLFDDTEVMLSLGLNEKESFQVVVEPIDDRMRDVTVEVGDLVSEDGAKIPSSQIDCDLVAFVRTVRKTDTCLDYVGWHPDPLIQSPRPVDVVVGDRQSWMVRVRALASDKPGVYRGNISVKSAGNAPVEIPLVAKVRPFTLPNHAPIPTSITYEGFGTSKMTSDPERWKTLRFQHADMLADHLINVDDIYRSPDPKGKKAIDWEVVEYLEKKGQLVGINLGYFYGSGDAHIESFRPNYEKAKDLGLLDKVYIYGFDERPSGEYKYIQQACEKFKKLYPEVMVMVTAQDHSYGFDPPMKDLTAWCPIINRFNPVLAEKARAENRRVWWYTCNWPRYPYPDVYVDYPGTDLRMLLGAMAYKYKPDGFLYFHSVIWTKEDREHGIDSYPYTRWNPWNFVSTNGDGSLFDIDGEGRLVATLRTESYRDGLEDLAALMVLDATREAALAEGSAKAKAWSATADKAAAAFRALVPARWKFERDPAKIAAARLAVDECLEASPVPAANPWKGGMGIWGLSGNQRNPIKQ